MLVGILRHQFVLFDLNNGEFFLADIEKVVATKSFRIG